MSLDIFCLMDLFYGKPFVWLSLMAIFLSVTQIKQMYIKNYIYQGVKNIDERRIKKNGK